MIGSYPLPVSSLQLTGGVWQSTAGCASSAERWNPRSGGTAFGHDKTPNGGFAVLAPSLGMADVAQRECSDRRQQTVRVPFHFPLALALQPSLHYRPVSLVPWYPGLNSVTHVTSGVSAEPCAVVRSSGRRLGRFPSCWHSRVSWACGAELCSSAQSSFCKPICATASTSRRFRTSSPRCGWPPGRRHCLRYPAPASAGWTHPPAAGTVPARR